MGKILKKLLNMLLLLLVILTIAFAAMFIRLSVKPMDAAFLFNFAHKYVQIPKELSFSKTQLFWPKSSYGPELVLVGAQWDMNGQTIPLGNIGVATDLVKIAQGDFALSKVSFRNVTFEITDEELAVLTAVKEKDPNIEQKDHRQAPDIAQIYNILTLLGAVVLEDAHVVFHDTKSGRTRVSPKLTASLYTEGDQFKLLGIVDDAQKFLKKPAQLYASLHKDTSAISGNIWIEGLDLRPLNQFEQIQKFVNINQSGNIRLAAQVSGDITNFAKPNIQVQWQLRSNDFSMNIIQTKQPTMLDAFNIDGFWSVPTGIMGLRSISIQAKEDGGLIYDLPIEKASATGYLNIKDKFLHLMNIQAQTRLGRTLDGSYKISWARPHPQHTFSIVHDGTMPVEEFIEIWPESAARGARIWIKEHLKGNIHDLLFGVSIVMKTKQGVYTNLSGGLRLSDGHLWYNANNPAIEKIQGNINFDQDNIAMDIVTAQSGDITIKDAVVEVQSAHHKKTPLLKISVPVQASLKDTLTYMRNFNPNMLPFIDDSQMASLKGDIDGDIALKLPLSNKVDYQRMQVQDLNLSGKGKLLALNYPAQNLTSNLLAFDLKADSISVAGDAQVKSIALNNISLMYPFNVTQEKPWQLTAKAQANAEDLAKDFTALQPVVTQLDWRGNIASDVNLTGRENIDVTVKSDLTQSAFVAQPLGSKAKGTKATLTTSAHITSASLQNLTLAFKSDDFDTAAKMSFKNNNIQLLDITKLNHGQRTRLTGKYIPMDGKNLLNLAGTLDISTYQTIGPKDGKKSEKTKGAKPLDISLDLSTVYLKDFNLQKVQATAIYKDNMLYQLNSAASTQDNTAFYVNIQPTGKGRQLELETQNGGDIMHGFNIYPYIQGGVLKISAFSPFEYPDRWNGKLEMYDFKLKEAPTITHLLGALNLTQLDSTLSGNGITFEKAFADFQLSDTALEISGGEVIGPSLGGKLDGLISRKDNTLNFKGKIIPLAGISKFASSVPVVGGILSGTQKDGIFVADFGITGTKENPQIKTFPLSTVTPGIFREIFQSLN